MKRVRAFSYLFVIVLLASALASPLTMPTLAKGAGPGESNSAESGDPDPVLGEQLTRMLVKANEEDKTTIWAQLTEHEKSSVIVYNTVVKVTADVFDNLSTNDEMTITVSGCDVRGLKEKGYNAFGAVLWEYYSRVEWCYNGSTVTSKFATRTGTPGPFPSLWEYLGDAVPPVEGGGVGQSYYRIWCNGYFRLAIAGYPIQTAYPWIDITVRGNGTSSATSGQ